MKFLNHHLKTTLTIVAALAVFIVFYKTSYALSTPVGGWNHNEISRQLQLTNDELGKTAQNTPRYNELLQDQKELTAMQTAAEDIETDYSDDDASATIDKLSKDMEALGVDPNTGATTRYVAGTPEAASLGSLYLQLAAKKNQVLGKPNDVILKHAKAYQDHAIAGADKNAEVQGKKAAGCDPGVSNLYGLLSTNCMLFYLARITMFLVWIFSWLLWGVNQTFNFILTITVRDFSHYLNLPGIKAAWGVARDLVNVSLLFVLLYAAIGLIMNLSSIDSKRIVTRVILVALLVNFSFFFTGTIIKASNTVAVFLYDKANTGGTSQTFGKGTPDISSKLIQGFMTEPKTSSEPGEYRMEYTLGNIIGSFASQIALILITSIALGAAVIMFSVRFVKLLLLAVLSPLAFLGATITGFKGHAGKWLSSLISMCIFPVIFLIFLYMVTQLAVATDTWGFPQNAAGPSALITSIVIGVLINGLMIAGLIAANELGATGAGWATSKLKGMGDSVKGWAGRTTGRATFGTLGYTGQNTVGRLGRRIADSESLKKLASSGGVGGWFGRRALRASDSAAKSSFDVRATKLGQATGISQLGKAGGKGGYDKAVEEKAKKEKDFTKLLEASKTKQREARETGKAEQELAKNEQAAAKQELATHQENIQQEEVKLNIAKANAQNIETKPIGTKPGEYPNEETRQNALWAAQQEVETIKNKVERMRTDEMQAIQNKIKAAEQKEKEAKEVTANAANVAGTTRKKSYADYLAKGGLFASIIHRSTKKNRENLASDIRSDAEKSKDKKNQEKVMKAIAQITDGGEGGSEKPKENEPPTEPKPTT